eukprot:12270804-Heterocapsa_arctica.AAC.1
MFWHDICKCMTHCPQLRAELHSHGWNALPFSPSFLSFRVGELHSYMFDSLELLHAHEQVHLNLEYAEPDPFLDPRLPYACTRTLNNGDLCDREFLSDQALRLHCLKTHGYCNPLTCAIVTNQCPWCSRVLTNIKQAKVHVHARGIRGTCPLRTRANPVEIQDPPTWACPFCNQ